MIKILLIFLMVIVPQMIRAQSMGHPGGGRDFMGKLALTGLPKAQWMCLVNASKAQVLEKEFSKYWKKDYANNNFFNLMDTIALHSIFKLLSKLQPLKSSPTYLCELNETENSLNNISSRPHYKQELKILKDLVIIWEAGIKEMKEPNQCFVHFKKRSIHLNKLKLLIKTYEKSSK